ncbi:LON peptidase substrate-binding domain-containing protein [Segetibacter aerophilus]|uniref:ATP-dependent protease n=1 Tax=Segetibacter aerophilus TaxID=670293 RepID=A0A512BET1_9BACT|nr:LON peptidase substrate-binding domain-containing protein [Segetibacter aerophilus]GEO10489.1 ATP-dependent protease [Segetibacter aerophilus]
MTNFIPIFPLGIVVFPGEDLNLHIFEPRYKQLITDCFADAKPFGIPTVLKNGLSERGTLVEVKEIVEVYDDGKLDIKTKGLSIFRILEVVKDIPDKLYSGAIVNYPQNEESKKLLLLQKVVKSIKDLHAVLKLKKDFKKPDDELVAYDIAHHVGLSLEEEYEFAGLFREDQRLEYLKRHLLKVLPVVNEMEVLKDRIKLNGHFKNLSGNFDL